MLRHHADANDLNRNRGGHHCMCIGVTRDSMGACRCCGATAPHSRSSPEYSLGYQHCLLEMRADEEITDTQTPAALRSLPLVFRLHIVARHRTCGDVSERGANACIRQQTWIGWAIHIRHWCCVPDQPA
jgi:hypothetical protein